MKIAGHPVHMMLIHFPTALFPMDLVFGLICLYAGLSSLALTAFYVMVGGVVFGWLSILSGAVDLLHVMDSKPHALKTVLMHGGINMTVIFVYTVLAYLKYRHYPAIEPDGRAVLILKMVTLGMVIIGNFMGGRLILKYRVAVENNENA